jgi:hypothetical protein
MRFGKTDCGDRRNVDLAHDCILHRDLEIDVLKIRIVPIQNLVGLTSK